MNTNPNQEENKAKFENLIPSPFKDASRLGIYLGLFFALKFLCIIFFLDFPLLVPVFLGATLIVPFISYRLTKSYRERYFVDKPFSFRLAWVHGTWLYFFATIVLLLPVYYFYTRTLPEAIPVFQQNFDELYALKSEMKEQVFSLFQGDPMDQVRLYVSSDHLFENLLGCVTRNFVVGGLLSIINAYFLRRA